MTESNTTTADLQLDATPSRPLSHVRRALASHPWAIEPSVFDAMLEVLERRVLGIRLSPGEIEAAVGDRVEARANRRAPAAPGVAVLPLRGIMTQHGGVDEASHALFSTDRYRRQLVAAGRDPDVGSIVMDIDSPGGSAYGLAELAQAVREIRNHKPVVAVANSNMKSGAYYVGSQAGELVVTPGSQVGSIGVLVFHDDLSEAAAREGIKRTYVSAPVGGFKTEGNPFEELGEEAFAEAQRVVNTYYDAFVADVAAGRNVSQTKVREEFGRGRSVLWKDAVAVGMADREGTLDQVVEELASRGSRKRSRRSAQAEAARLRSDLIAAG